MNEGDVCDKTVHCADGDCDGDVGPHQHDFEDIRCQRCGALYEARLCEVVFTGHYAMGGKRV